MKPAPQREAALFQAAARMGIAERILFLNGVCRGDRAWCAFPEALLFIYDQPDTVLKRRST